MNTQLAHGMLHTEMFIFYHIIYTFFFIITGSWNHEWQQYLIDIVINYNWMNIEMSNAYDNNVHEIACHHCMITSNKYILIMMIVRYDGWFIIDEKILHDQIIIISEIVFFCVITSGLDPSISSTLNHICFTAALLFIQLQFCFHLCEREKRSAAVRLRTRTTFAYIPF